MGATKQLLEEGERLRREEDLAGAVVVFERALAAAEQEFGEGSKELILPLWRLGEALCAHRYEACDELTRAIALGERGIALAEQDPIDNLQLASLLNSQAIVLWLNSRHLDAVAAARRAVAVRQRFSRDTRSDTELIIEIFLDLDMPDEALNNARELVALDEQIRGQVADYSLYLYADALRRTGRDEEAKQVLETLLTRQLREGMESVVRRWLFEIGSSRT